MNKSSPIPEQTCNFCHYRMDATTDAFGEATPKPGDYSICLNCGKIGVFDENLVVQKPTPEEQDAINKHAQVTHAQMARAMAVTKDLRNTN